MKNESQIITSLLRKKTKKQSDFKIEIRFFSKRIMKAQHDTF